MLSLIEAPAENSQSQQRWQVKANVGYMRPNLVEDLVSRSEKSSTIPWFITQIVFNFPTMRFIYYDNTIEPQLGNRENYYESIMFKKIPEIEKQALAYTRLTLEERASLKIKYLSEHGLDKPANPTKSTDYDAFLEQEYLTTRFKELIQQLLFQ